MLTFSPSPLSGAPQLEILNTINCMAMDTYIYHVTLIFGFAVFTLVYNIVKAKKQKQ